MTRYIFTIINSHIRYSLGHRSIKEIIIKTSVWVLNHKLNLVDELKRNLITK